MSFLTKGPTHYEVASMQRFLHPNYVVFISEGNPFIVQFDLVKLDWINLDRVILD